MAEEQNKDGMLNKTKKGIVSKVDDFTTGQEGSFFWLVRWVYGFINELINMMNEQVQDALARRRKKIEDEDDL